MIDVQKLIMLSELQGYKNNNIYTGSFNISGSYNGTSKVVNKTITLPSNVSNVDIVFKGRANGGFSVSTGDPRPNSSWFKRGAVWVRGSGSGYTDTPLPFEISAKINGDKLTITAASYRQFFGSLSLKTESVSYRVVDYSSF